MAKISVNDVIFATFISLGGKVVASMRLIGMSGLSSILKSLRGNAAGEVPTGLVTLNVRNTTAGWQYTSRILLR